jgi:hypothetical protein
VLDPDLIQNRPSLMCRHWELSPGPTVYLFHAPRYLLRLVPGSTPNSMQLQMWAPSFNQTPINDSPTDPIHIPIANVFIHPTTGTRDRAATDKFGCLAQGVGGHIEGLNTIFCIPHSAVPKDKTITYGHFLLMYAPTNRKYTMSDSPWGQPNQIP